MQKISCEGSSVQVDSRPVSPRTQPLVNRSTLRPFPMRVHRLVAPTKTRRHAPLPAVRRTFVHSWQSILVYAISAIALGAAPARSQTPGILFVQSNWVSKPATSSTVAVPFAAAQVAGDLNIVVVTWIDASAQVQAVSDTTGNIYQRAVGPTVRSTVASQSLYYAVNQAT